MIFSIALLTARFTIEIILLVEIRTHLKTILVIFDLVFVKFKIF